jgi:2'-5' RNA ligase
VSKNLRYCALWLLPDDPSFQRAVEHLSTVHRAPQFTAHLTVLSRLPEQPASAACSALAELAAATAPLTLVIRGVDHSDEYFEAVCVRCVESDGLRALRDRALDAFGAGHAPATGPHVALLYAQLETEARSAIAGAQRVEGRLRCSTLALVQSGPLGWRPVQDWRVLCRAALRA